MGATQHGFGLLLLDAAAAERKGEFLATAHRQDRVEQTSGWKNVHGCDTKIRPQGLVDGLRDDLRMTDGVRAFLVDPRVKGSDIHVVYFLALPSHGMQGHGACSPPKKGLEGVPKGRLVQRSSQNVRLPHPCRPDGPTHTPTFRGPCNRL